jgi:hypothetical protein
VELAQVLVVLLGDVAREERLSPPRAHPNLQAKLEI